MIQYSEFNSFSMLQSIAKRFVDKSLTPIQKIELDKKEQEIIEESRRDKYVPALQASIRNALLATPGFVLIPGAELAMGVIASFVGVSWFAVSLKDVKERFASFGINLTKDMLEACLTGLFTFVLTSGIKTVLPVLREFFYFGIKFSGTAPEVFIQKVMQNEFFEVSSMASQLVLAAISAGVLFRVTHCVTNSIIKHDVNDTLLTGASSDAQSFFQKASNRLYEISDQLTQPENTLKKANYFITSGVEIYLESCARLGINIDALSKMYAEIATLNMVNSDQGQVDQKTIAFFLAAFEPYAEFVEHAKDLQPRFQRITQFLKNLEQEQEQSLVDVIFADAFRLLADLFKEYKYQLVT